MDFVPESFYCYRQRSGSIRHSIGDKNCRDLADAILAQFPNARITIEPTTALCSFYAEAGGLMIGFEGGYNAENDPEKF